MTTSALRLPIQSLMPPENTLTIEVVASATPSIRPTDSALAPITVTRNIGSRLWMISDEVSMNIDTIPSATTVRGIARSPLWTAAEPGSAGAVITGPGRLEREREKLLTMPSVALRRYGRNRILPLRNSEKGSGDRNLASIVLFWHGAAPRRTGCRTGCTEAGGFPFQVSRGT
jgi:hypothetical protein